MMVFLMILAYFWGRTARTGAVAMAMLAGTAMAATAQAGTPTLDVAGVAVGHGPLVVAVYDNHKDFLGKPMRTLKAPATVRRNTTPPVSPCRPMTKASPSACTSNQSFLTTMLGNLLVMSLAFSDTCTAILRAMSL